jgi:hypothetical protein
MAAQQPHQPARYPVRLVLDFDPHEKRIVFVKGDRPAQVDDHSLPLLLQMIALRLPTPSMMSVRWSPRVPRYGIQPASKEI